MSETKAVYNSGAPEPADTILTPAAVSAVLARVQSWRNTHAKADALALVASHTALWERLGFIGHRYEETITDLGQCQLDREKLERELAAATEAPGG